MVGLMVTHKQIWWNKESLNTTYNITTLTINKYIFDFTLNLVGNEC